MSIALRRNALAALIKNNSDMSIYDAMNDNMNVILPGSQGYTIGNAVLYNFEYGKTYHIIAKAARSVPNGTFGFYVYKGNANSPNVYIGISEQGETMTEITYTHEETDTYTRLGVWANNSNDRNSSHPIIVYIEEI